MSEYEICEDIRLFHSISVVTFYDFSADDEIRYLEFAGEWREYATTS